MGEPDEGRPGHAVRVTEVDDQREVSTLQSLAVFIWAGDCVHVDGCWRFGGVVKGCCGGLRWRREEGWMDGGWMVDEWRMDGTYGGADVDEDVLMDGDTRNVNDAGDALLEYSSACRTAQ